MITLFQTDIADDGRHSSKGNQLKWRNNGHWYKADYCGYEGMSEYVCSKLLERSTLSSDEFTLYDTEIIKYNNRMIKGCVSADFLKDGEQLITLERLFMNYYGRSFYQAVWAIRGTEERLEFVNKQVEQMTGICDFGSYLSKMMAIDAFFLNEDRHMHNIAVIKTADGHYRLCPFFDNGSSLMSDTAMDYPLNIDIYTLIPGVKSKTVSSDFAEQADAAESLFGRQIGFDFTAADAEKIIYNEQYYDSDIKKRVVEIIHEQMRRYRYLF